MEWVLQVADEFDDAFGVLRHGWLGLVAEIGAVSLGRSASVQNSQDPRSARSRHFWAPVPSRPTWRRS
jgi:hypothetical protein